MTKTYQADARLLAINLAAVSRDNAGRKIEFVLRIDRASNGHGAAEGEEEGSDVGELHGDGKVRLINFLG